MLNQIKFFSILLFSLTSAIAAHATGITTLDGEYKFIGTDGKAPIRLVLTLKDGKMTTSTEDGSTTHTIDAEITDGAQPDFLKAIRNMTPAGMVFYKTTTDIATDGKPVPLTVVDQSQSDYEPRLTFYAILDGNPIPVLAVYDSTQTAIFEQAWASATTPEQK